MKCEEEEAVRGSGERVFQAEGTAVQLLSWSGWANCSGTVGTIQPNLSSQGPLGLGGGALPSGGVTAPYGI